MLVDTKRRAECRFRKIIHYCEMEIDFIKKKNDDVTHADVEEFAAEI